MERTEPHDLSEQETDKERELLESLEHLARRDEPFDAVALVVEGRR